ncbi:MAG: hypothetical protein PVH02_11940 [Desulfobacteraceae bacterium]|jgi:hypothetical protein
MNKKQEIKDLPAILFPHAYLPEPMVKKILSFFGPITIFQPWFMERPVLGSGANEANAVQVLRPPDDLKPGEDFMIRLSEYRHWIEQNSDKGYTEFLQVSQENDLTEDTTWEIRQMIRRGTRQASAPQEDPALKWHLILHLAQDVEDQKLEADKALMALREKDVPLKGTVEESGEMDHLLADLAPFGSEPIGDEYRLRQILEAWLALFGGYLNEKALLVTSSRHVMDYVTDLWKESQYEEQGEALASICFKFPDLSQRTLGDLAEIKETRLNDDKIRELKALILDLGKNAANNVSRLEPLAKEVEASGPWEISKGVLNIVVNYFAPLRESGQKKMHRVLKQISNKTIILVEG